MNSSLTAADFSERFSTALTTLLNNWIKRSLGPNADNTVLGLITWADLGAMLCLVLLVLVVNSVAVAIVRHKTKQTAATAEGKDLQHHVFGALGKPLYVLIWAYGAFFAATPLLLKLNPDEGLLVVREFFANVFNLGVFAALFWFFFRLTHVLEARLAVWASTTSSKLDALLVPLLGKSLRVIVPVMAIIFALPILNLPPDYAAVVAKGTSILLIVALAIILFEVVDTCEKAVLTTFDITAADNLRARKVYTQVHLISKVIYVIIGLFTVATVLMLFEEVRHIGASLLASAGIVGIIAGVAAQKPLANLFAGFQIALAQPMRQDDVVIVEGEWGRVEEITLTYVVVRIWDDRRMVLPLSYFVDKPFQNWTRTSAGLLGSIYVWVDYSFPVDEGRKALKQIIENSPLWDKRFWNMQVSDASEKTMQLRVLATSADSSQSWDLRCEIREKFIAYIQKHHPQSLPQLRTQLSSANTESPI
ncbi:MAG: mechanosensitive ion channel domain-containing protein [Steroidobacteraceae bacterium]